MGCELKGDYEGREEIQRVLSEGVRRGTRDKTRKARHLEEGTTALCCLHHVGRGGSGAGILRRGHWECAVREGEGVRRGRVRGRRV